MNPLKNNGQSPRRPRQSKNVFTTKNGTDIRMNRSLGERRKARKDAIARQRAARLSVLPANRFKRTMYRLHPKRLAAYWFSREGAIMGLKIAGVGIIVCFLLLVGLFAYFRKDLPDLTDVSGNNSPGSISYYDKTGQTLLWQDYDAVKRIPVPYERQNDYIRNATIAIEDKDFYSEGAFNVRGIARAAVDNAMNKGGPRQGGSTITQQLVKLNLNWTNDRSYTRKIKELILAVELEREYSKNDIITGYLNSAPYGGIEVGVESAARDYFNSTAKELKLEQAVFLAAIPQAPAYYSPYNTETFEKDLLVGRMNYIYDRMVEQKMITDKEAAAAKKIDVAASVRPLQPKYAGIKAPYFVLAAKKELNSSYLGDSTKRGGWKIYTTLDLDLQNLAEKQVNDGIGRVKIQKGDTAALVTEDVKTGEIVAAAVAGSDFIGGEFGQLNFASSVQVSPGSSIKPYDYAAFIDKSNNVGGGSVLYDTQGPILDKNGAGYRCTDKKRPTKTDPGGNCLWNYDFGYPGPVTLRYALGGSRNVPAVKAMITTGYNETIGVMNGLMAKDKAYVCYPPDTNVFEATPKDETQCYSSSALGDGAYLHLDDHVNGLASLSRMGQAMKKTYISRIIDADNKPIEMHKRETKQAIRPDSAYIVNDMAADRKASYLNGLTCGNGPCSFHDYKGWKMAIKTGTTNDGYDGLMASWSGRYAAVAWVGHHTRTVSMDGSMERMTGPIVRGWMQGAHDKLGGTPQNWQQPKGVQTLPAFVIRSKVSRLGESVPSAATDLYPSWYKPKTASNAAAVIDRVSNKLATDCTPAAAKQTVGNSNANNFSVDQFVGGNRGGAVNTSASDDIHKCDDLKPSVNLTVSSSDSGNTTTSCDKDGCTIAATVSQGTHPLTSSSFPGKLTIAINGQTVRSFDISGGNSPQTFTHSFKPEGDGTAQITATVTDSVLYGASNSATVTTSGGGGDDEEDEQAVNNNNGSGNNRRGGRGGLLNPLD